MAYKLQCLMKSVTLLYNVLEILTSVLAPVIMPWCFTKNLF